MCVCACAWIGNLGDGDGVLLVAVRRVALLHRWVQGHLVYQCVCVCVCVCVRARARTPSALTDAGAHCVSYIHILYPICRCLHAPSYTQMYTYALTYTQNYTCGQHSYRICLSCCTTLLLFYFTTRARVKVFLVGRTHVSRSFLLHHITTVLLYY